MRPGKLIADVAEVQQAATFHYQLRSSQIPQNEGYEEEVDVRRIVEEMYGVEISKDHDREAMESNLWISLPRDMLSVVFSLLCFADRIAVSSVCKSWREKAFALSDTRIFARGNDSEAVQRSYFADSMLTSAPPCCALGPRSNSHTEARSPFQHDQCSAGVELTLLHVLVATRREVMDHVDDLLPH